MKQAVEISNLTKQYPGFLLNDISFAVEQGTIMGLIGENGAGKTTTIKLMLNLINRDKGTIKIFGKDNIKEEKLIKEDIGVILGEAFFSPMINARDISLIMKKISKRWDDEKYNQYLEKFDLPKNKKIKELSKGMVMKLQMATVLSKNPKLLILDEPTSGLDPVVRNEILDIFLDFIQDEEKTILLSSHITTDLERIADNITFINKGSVVLSESKDELLNKYGILKCDESTFKKLDKKDVVKYRHNRYDYEVLINNKNEAKKKYADTIVDKPTIEDIMLLYVKGETL